MAKKAEKESAKNSKNASKANSGDELDVHGNKVVNENIETTAEQAQALAKLSAQVDHLGCVFTPVLVVMSSPLPTATSPHHNLNTSLTVELWVQSV